MLGIVTMAGNALRAFGNTHPAVKWGVIVLAGLLAVEFVGKEAISLYVAMSTAPAQIEQVNEQAKKTAGDAAQARAQAEFANSRPATSWNQIKCEQKHRTWDTDAQSCKSN